MRPYKYFVIILSLLLVTSFRPPSHAQTERSTAPVQYTRSEHLIPMRDGVKLFTIVYALKDGAQKNPILLNRTPYGVSGYISEAGSEEGFFYEGSPFGGYIMVLQDVRGRYRSEGKFIHFRPYKPVKRGPADTDESTDAYDTIEWLLKNIPNNNGRVGIWGLSYDGFYAAMGLIDAHPALKAVLPHAPAVGYPFNGVIHRNGSFDLNMINLLSIMDNPNPEKHSSFEVGSPEPSFDKKAFASDYYFFLKMVPLSSGGKYLDRANGRSGYRFWNELMQHGTYDEFWNARNLPHNLKNVRPAVMTVGEWFDERTLTGPFALHKSIEKQSPNTFNILVIGPGGHGAAWNSRTRQGDISFGPQSPDFAWEPFVSFFDYFLKDKGEMNLPKVIVFETGSNERRTYAEWPPKNAKPQNIYLHANGRLAFSPPAPARPAFDEYVSDPNDPVPYVKEFRNLKKGIVYQLGDQRFAAERSDVLTYKSDVLAEDITVAGPIVASLFVSTSGTDSDYVVKVIDVFPDDAPNDPGTRAKMAGYQMLLRGEPMRAKFRKSFSKPEPMRPNRVEKVEFTLTDVNHRFLKGHRIMVQIQSSLFPVVDRNPQKFVDIYHAKESDFQKASQRVYRSGRLNSHLKLNILK